MRYLFAYAAGLVFGLGISLSGMANPAKVLNFFNVAGTWDPSLAFVMGGALAVTFVGYRLVLRQSAPVLAEQFNLPTKTRIDARLLAGAAIFGIGWGIAGFCPGGALPALGTGRTEVLIFVAAMIAGIVVTRLLCKTDRVARCAQSKPERQAQEEGTMLDNQQTPYPVDMSVCPEVSAHFDEATNTISYIVKDPATNACAIVDSVMDIDYAAGRITYDHADTLIAEIEQRGLELEWIIESHVHADHLSAAPYIQEKLGGKIGVGSKILVVQETFGKVFNEGTEFQRDGSQFDKLFEDGDTYSVGQLACFAIYTPGHTPACMVHVMGDAAFVGDTLFMPDGGSARADFPGGDAGTLYDSIQKVLALPDEMRLFMCHDYGPGGRDIAWETTVAEEKANNIHVGGGKTREQFVEFRTKRDAVLDMPKLIIPSLQVNMRAGEVPTDEDGNPMLKVPVNAL